MPTTSGSLGDELSESRFSMWGNVQLQKFNTDINKILVELKQIEERNRIVRISLERMLKEINNE